MEYIITIRSVAPVDILIKVVNMKDGTKKALKTIAEEDYKACIEILIGVILLIISKYI